MKKMVWLFIVVSLAALLLASCAAQETGVQHSGKQPSGGASEPKAGGDKRVVNIGLQQSLDPMRVTKEKGFFEQAFGEIGVEVNWIEFQSGALYFEAMAAERLDLGLAASAPVVVGQAANIDFKIIALTTDGLNDSSLIVAKDSPIRELSDLRGKKIAVARGSSAWYFLYKVLEAAELQPTDLDIVYLEPNEAQSAFDGGSVDAWAIWDPLLTHEIQAKEARVLIDNQAVGAISPIFGLARTKFAEAHPDLVVKFLQTYEKGRQWYHDYHDEAADILATFKKMEKPFVSDVMGNINRINQPVDETYIKAHQEIADFLFQHDVIKQKLDVSKLVDNSYYEKAGIGG